MIQMNLFTEKKQTDRENKLIITKGEMGREKLEIWDQQIHTTIYKVDKKGLLYSRGNCIQYLVITLEKKLGKYHI